MKKYRTQKKTLREGGVSLLVLLCLLLSPFSSANAYFDVTEISLENLFSASSINISLGVSGEGTRERSITVSNIGRSPFNYDSHVTETSDPLLSFCDEVNVTLDDSETDLLSLTTALAPLAVDDAESVNLEFSVDDPNADLSGKVCIVEFIFDASQEGFNHGEAFYDTETYTLTFYGEDFDLEPEPEDPCCACGNITVINNNDATIVNNVTSTANTGGNSAGSGGIIVTGNATTTTTVINNANTNHTTIGCGNEISDEKTKHPLRMFDRWIRPRLGIPSILSGTIMDGTAEIDNPVEPVVADPILIETEPEFVEPVEEHVEVEAGDTKALATEEEETVEVEEEEL